MTDLGFEGIDMITKLDLGSFSDPYDLCVSDPVCSRAEPNEEFKRQAETGTRDGGRQ